MQESNPQQIEKQRIIDNNLAMMKNSMQTLLCSESIGGNAKSIRIKDKDYSCAAANGYVDRQGKIIAFGNVQDLPKETTAKNDPFTFRVAVDLDISKPSIYFIIVEIIQESKLSPNVLEILNICKNKYNHDLELLRNQ